MADEGRTIRDAGLERVLLEASVGAYEVRQMPTGRAGLFDKATGISADNYAEFRTNQQWTLTKTAGFVALKGGRAYWDHSANAVYFKKVNDRDFYIGRFAEDATSAATSCVVEPNIDPPYDIDLARSGFLSVLAGTPAAGGFGYPVNLGGTLIFELTATNEAQKVDALSVEGFAKGANAIIRAVFRVMSDGGAGAQDISIGVANGTHATDADSIAESVFLHLNGGDLNIYAESDDGTTEVAATDTTIDYTEGTALANRVEGWIDMRDPASVKIYVEGSRVLTGSTFNVDASSGPWFLLVHAEKTATTDTYKLGVDALQAWFAEQ